MGVLFVKKIILAFLQQLNEYIFTSIMIAFCIFIFFFIPQINLIFELPQLAISKDFFISILLFFFLSLLILIYVKASFLVIPQNKDSEASSPEPFFQAFLDLYFTPSVYIILLLITLSLFGVFKIQNLVQLSDFFIVFPLIFMMGAGLGINEHVLKKIYFKIRKKQIFIPLGIFCILLAIPCISTAFYSEGVFIGLLGFWFLSHSLQTFLERFFNGKEIELEISLFYETTGRSLFFFFSSLILGELLFQGAIHMQQLFSYRNYTLWGIAHLFFTLILCARVLDEIKYLRIFLLTAPIFFLLLLQPIFIGKESASASLDPKLITEQQLKLSIQWFKSFKHRMEQSPSDQPVLFMAAAGGGSRAAIFTALVLECLRDPYKYTNQMNTCETGEDAKDSYASVWNANDNYAKNIVLMSSVSGGSLACAYFAQTDPRHQNLFVQNSLENQLLQDIQRLLQKRESFKIAGKYIGPSEKEIKQWISSTFVDDMSADFIAPLLRGILFRLDVERGESVSEVWENEFIWKEIHNQQNFLESQAPLLVLNSANVEKGLRFAIGFPPLPTKRIFSETAGDVITTLSDWKPFYQLQLADAVRLSANFPWGFEVAQLSTQQSFLDYFDSQKNQEIFLTDGGVTDNTGIDSVVMVLKRLRFYAKIDILEERNSESCLQENKLILTEEAKKLAQEAHTLAKEILEALASRGLIMLEVDSGAKPDNKESPAVLRPLQALNTAGFANAILAKTKNYEEIEKYLNPKDGAPEEAVPWSFVAFENPGSVVTTWGLGPKDKARTFVDFLEEVVVNGKEKKLKRQMLEFQLLNRLRQLSKAFESILLQTEVKKMSLILKDTSENKYKTDFFNTAIQQQDIRKKISSLQQQISNKELSTILEIWTFEHSKEILKKEYAHLIQKGLDFDEKQLKKVLQKNCTDRLSIVSFGIVIQPYLFFQCFI